ncbi:Retinal-specific ATP-binding cassette transporter [Eumeta japonica]|uniref:Retinal-specific ATP-binding cassette transporter n=1 Tax=Eumeta variegata TaxID=151549 RepID=A0A4C1XGU9_EUMVA|nr:Retinal-specific ATP-binding cassette transporter [Eumeta japonica]
MIQRSCGLCSLEADALTSQRGAGARLACLETWKALNLLNLLVLLIEQGLLTKPKEAIVRKLFGSPSLHYRDKMAAAERDYVRESISLPKGEITDALLAHELRKCYWNVISKPCHAVRGLSLSVKRGECFGLLGVNGAGKSTTFRMLTGECGATAGRAVAAAQPLGALRRRPYLDTLGYCPQFNALDPFLSGGANLRLLLLIRGLSPDVASRHALVWMRRVGLENLRERALSAYSGGCARRLGAAAALCTGAPLALLDEPTAGVDPAARRRLWTALRVALAQRRSLLITSHRNVGYSNDYDFTRISKGISFKLAVPPASLDGCSIYKLQLFWYIRRGCITAATREARAEYRSSTLSIISAHTVKNSFSEAIKEEIRRAAYAAVEKSP